MVTLTKQRQKIYDKLCTRKGCAIKVKTRAEVFRMSSIRDTSLIQYEAYLSVSFDRAVQDYNVRTGSKTFIYAVLVVITISQILYTDW